MHEFHQCSEAYVSTNGISISFDPGRESSIAEQLQEMLPKSQVVKAFNVLSAYALENNVQQGAKQVMLFNYYNLVASK